MVEFVGKGRDLFLVCCVLFLEMGTPSHGLRFHTQPGEFTAFLGDRLDKFSAPGIHFCPPFLQTCQGLVWWWHLVQAGPTQGIVPRTAHRPVLVVQWPARRVFPGNGIVSIQPPQAAIIQSPRRCRVQQTGLIPFLTLSRPDRQPIAACIVHERNPKDIELAPACRLLLLVLNLAQGFPQPVHQPDERREERQLQLGQIFAAREITGMGPCAHVDHRVFAHFFQLGIVPATAQVVAGIVVRGISDPLGMNFPLIRLGEVNIDRLPVGFMVVDAKEA